MTIILNYRIVDYTVTDFSTLQKKVVSFAGKFTRACTYYKSQFLQVRRK